jgi:hypothetical protein
MLQTDRLESLKAGTYSALASALAFTVLLATNSSILAARFESLQELRIENFSLAEMIGLAIASASGFVFGITYRYIVRSDRNSHLKSGAVMAFGLVRGLAQIDSRLHIPSPNIWLLGLLGLESLLLFAIAGIALDLAMESSLIKPSQI